MLYYLYKRIYLWSLNAIRQNHLKEYHFDIRCSNCREWFSVSKVRYEHKTERVTFGSSEIQGMETTCGQCGKVTKWNLEAAPIPLPCDENGTPAEVKKES